MASTLVVTSQDMTPAPGIVFGKLLFNKDMGSPKTLASDLVVLTELRDSTGPLASPSGYLVRKRDLVPLPGDEFALVVGNQIAEWDGTGFEPSNFSNSDHALVRIVGAYTGPETDAFTMVYNVEVVVPDPGGVYGSVGDVCMVTADDIALLNSDYAYALAGAPIEYHGPIGCTFSSGGLEVS